MKQFVPLECNPDVFNTLAHNFGVDNVEFVDIFSLDQDMLAFIPRPVLAILLVFPISEAYEKYRHEQDKGPLDPAGTAQWFPQTIGNACGTMAFLHATNGINPASINEPMAGILKETHTLGPEDRAKYLEASQAFEAAHNSVAEAGDTAAPGADESIEFHYVCLTKDRENRLVELDGRRRGPITRAPHIDDLLDQPALDVVHEFLSREGDGAFSMIAMVQSGV